MRKHLRVKVGGSLYKAHPVSGKHHLRKGRIVYILALVVIAVVYLRSGEAAIAAAAVLDVEWV